jgi:hypothetical protein
MQRPTIYFPVGLVTLPVASLVAAVLLPQVPSWLAKSLHLLFGTKELAMIVAPGALWPGANYYPGSWFANSVGALLDLCRMTAVVG